MVAAFIPLVRRFGITAVLCRCIPVCLPQERAATVSAIVNAGRHIGAAIFVR